MLGANRHDFGVLAISDGVGCKTEGADMLLVAKKRRRGANTVIERNNMTSFKVRERDRNASHFLCDVR